MTPNFAIGSTHDAKIGTQFIRFVPGTYSKSPRPDVAPRLTMGPASEVDETILQHVTQRDWRGGMGAVDVESGDKYWDADKIWVPEGNSNLGITVVGTFKVTGVAEAGAIKKFCQRSDGTYWIGINNSVYLLSKVGENWVITTPADKTFNGPILDMTMGAGGTDNHLWVSVGSGTNQGTWRRVEATGLWAKETNSSPGTMITPYLEGMWWGGHFGETEEKNKLFKYQGGTTETLVGRVGLYGYRINGLAIAMNQLWIGKEEGLYYHNGVSIAPQYVKSEMRAEYNCRRMAYQDGYLYFGMKNVLYRTSGGATGRLPFYFADPIYGITTIEQGILVSTKGTSTDRLYLLSRESLTPLLTATSIGEIFGKFSDASGGKVRWFETENRAEASGYYVGSKESGGFPNRDKLWANVRLVHNPLSGVKGHKIGFHYSFEDRDQIPGSFTTLGFSDIDGATEKTLSFPAQTKSRILVPKISLEVTDTNSSGPKLIQVSIGYLLGPVAQRMWSFVVDCSDKLILRNGEVLEQAGKELLDYLWNLNDSAQQVSLTDLDGSAKTVIVQGEREWGQRMINEGETRYFRGRAVEVGI